MPNEELCSKRSQSEDSSVTTIAADAQRWVKEAAGKTNGMTVCAQIAQAARNLGYREKSWRVRAAWFGQAGCWSAQAFRDLETRYRALEARQAALGAEIDRKHAALLRAGATVLEGSDEAMDRQEARIMRSHAERIVAARPRGRIG